MTYGKRTSGAAKYGKVAAESEAGFANPHRLVQMLMEGALDKVATAKGQEPSGHLGHVDHQWSADESGHGSRWPNSSQS